MRKWLIVIFITIFLLGVLQFATSQEMRIYNDGVIDYVPAAASFVLNAEDMESTLKEIQYSIDGSPLQVYNGPISLTEEGRHVIVYRALDKAENISSEKIYPVIIDASPPEGYVTINGPVHVKDSNYYITGKSSVVIWAEDSLSGVDAIWYSLDDGDFIEYTNPVSIGRDGQHTASLYAVDNVGNRTEVFSVTGYVDNSPPEVSIKPRKPLVGAGGKMYTNRDNEYSVVSDDAYVGTSIIMVSFDESDFVTYKGAFKVQVPGLHTIQAKAVDLLGNESNPTELSFYVDVKPPEAKVGVTLEE
jgi:hypothetical protein